MEEDRLGMMISSNATEIQKDDKNAIGVSIGGGAPHCPCLYVVQVFDGSPACLDGKIKAGDEIVSVNGILVKGERKSAVASMIKKSDEIVRIGFNVLHAVQEQGNTLDIAVKKIKHRAVESMASETADALGLSRAILCNDMLVMKLGKLEQNSKLYKKLIKYLNDLLRAQYHVAQMQKKFGDIFCEIASREMSTTANAALKTFGEAHRSFEKQTSSLIQKLNPIVRDLNTFVEKAIPDTKLTLKKYLNAKFEYLSFCLKLKEMDDEEAQFANFGEPLYRVETGNYEYRLMLRCRQESRDRFAKLRNDVLEKLELLDQKHVQDIAVQLSSFVKLMLAAHSECKSISATCNGLYPIEIDLTQIIRKYNTSGRLLEQDDDQVEEDPEPTNGEVESSEVHHSEEDNDLLDLS